MQADVAKARDLQKKGDVHAALKVLQRLTTTHPKDAVPWRELGNALALAGRDAEALEAFTKSTWIIGRHLDTWVAMAVCAHRLGRHKVALDYWRSALDVEPRLFQHKPQLAVLWRESRSQSNDFEKLARRLASREDVGAAWLFLEAVADPADVDPAIDALQKIEKETGSIRMARVALDAARSNATAWHSLRAILATLDDKTRTEAWGKTILWLCSSIGLSTDVVVSNALDGCTETAVARAAYRVASRNSRAHFMAVERLARSSVEIHRRINSAA
jgi:tetratricopeptide (TPR) repeat protein